MPSDGRSPRTSPRIPVRGLVLARYILKVPGAAAASPEDLVQAVGPTVQRYLSGDIGPAGVSRGLDPGDLTAP